MESSTQPPRRELPCINCGYPRRGLAHPLAPCPECGAGWADLSDPGRLVLKNACTLLCWSIPAFLLAWMSPRIFAVAHEQGTRPFVQDSRWFILIGAGVLALAVRQMARCQPGATARWLARVSVPVLVLLALHASGADEFFGNLLYGLLPNNYNFAWHVWPTLVDVGVAAGAIAAGAALAATTAHLGLTRAAERAWRVTVVAAIAVPVFHLWNGLGTTFLPDQSPFAVDKDSGSRRFWGQVVRWTLNTSDVGAPFLVSGLALVWWNTVMMLRSHLVAVPDGRVPTQP